MAVALKMTCPWERRVSTLHFLPQSVIIALKCVPFWGIWQRIPPSSFKVTEPTDKQERLLALFYVWIFYNVVYNLLIFVLISLCFLFGLCADLSLHKDTGRHAHTCMWYSGLKSGLGTSDHLSLVSWFAPYGHVLAGVEHFNNKSDFASHFLFHKVSMSEM